MRNFLLTTLFLAVFYVVEGQITFSPDPIEVTANASTENIQTDFELTNNGSDTARLAWKLEVLSQPEQWQYYVCDTENCYNFNQDISSEARPNIIPPGESIIVMFHALPGQSTGEGTYSIEFFDLDNDTIKVEVPITINTITTSTEDFDVKGLTIFPNPTTDFFRVNTGDLISRIDIVTVVGKKVASFPVRQGGFYDVSDLNLGIYYVRLLDSAGDSVKVMKLRKN